MEGKIVIKPHGYTVNNNLNMGTLTHVSGSQWSGTNINLFEVRDKIGEASYNIKDLCLSNNIKKWAAFKPNSLTESKQNQHGLFPDEGDAPYDWQYHKPTDLSMYSLYEFLGYNHNPQTPGLSNVELHDSNSVIKNVWNSDLGLVYWENEDTTHKIRTRILLPEWDITGFDEGGYSISHARIIPFIDNSSINPEIDTPKNINYGVNIVEITNSIMSEKAINLEFSFTPVLGTDGDGVTWAPQQGTTGGESIKVYILIQYYLDSDRTLDWNSDTLYANFPSDAEGVIEATAELQYKYYWGYKEFEWEKVEVGETGEPIDSGVGRVIVKINRETSEAELEVTSVHYEGTHSESPVLDSGGETYAYKVTYKENEEIWAEPEHANEWYFFNNGIVGDHAGDV